MTRLTRIGLPSSFGVRPPLDDGDLGDVARDCGCPGEGDRSGLATLLEERADDEEGPR